MKRATLLVLLFCSLCVALPMASAQMVDLSFGMGTVQDKSNGAGLDYNTLASCSPVTDSSCSAIDSDLSGVMMGFHGDVMITKRFGAGADVVFQPARQSYANFNAISPGEQIQSRLTFYDFNAVATPLGRKRVSLHLEGGFGGASLRFYDTVNQGSAIGNTNSSQYLSSANHFQLHAGIGVPIYLHGQFFVRPQFDFHYVPNLNQQYNSDVVTQEMIWVGYTFGR